jgi:hypothetical protein
MVLPVYLSKADPMKKLKMSGLSILFFFLFFCYNPLCAAPIEINSSNGNLSINAEKIQLVHILEAIAKQTGIKFMTGADLDEEVSCRIQNEPTEDALKKLLKDYNFAILFRKDKDFIDVDTVKIMGSKDLAYLEFNSSSGKSLKNPDNGGYDSTKSIYNKSSFIKEWEDTKKLSGQIKAERISNENSSNVLGTVDQRLRGIRVLEVAENSIFDKIGIRINDRIADINGTSVNSASDLISLMKSNSKKNIIRIERYGNDGIDSIYIEFK